MLQPFTSSWELRREPDGEYAPVALPHDAMLAEGRSPDSPAGAHCGYFLGGRYTYRTSWFAPEDLADHHVSLVFEAVYRRSEVLVNGRRVGGARGGYTTFEVRIDEALVLGEDNHVEVTVDNADLPNTRWYSGSGIYRPVWLRVDGPVHVRPDGVRFRTRSVGAVAVADLAVEVANPSGELLEVVATLVRDGVVAGRATGSTTATLVDLELTVPDAALWSADEPHLYRCDVEVRCAGELRAREELAVGLRVVEVDGAQGLRVNGTPVLLRGTNLHHDQGVLGAATFDASELRRVRLLKENGFNAVRSAHNPASRALLDACDQLGMYVMDELYDGWYDHKVEQDDAEFFAECWRSDAQAMVAKDRNHPSVVMYSIGNENTEPATAYGVETARTMADFVRGLDATRSVTMGVNLMSAALSWPTRRKGSATEPPRGKQAPKMDSTMVNAVANQFGRLMSLTPRLKRTDAVTRDLFEVLDVAGYNYGTVRYATDAQLHPDRVVVGTETLPGQIAENWALVEALPSLVGDFMWAGWDYLGEAGMGVWTYGSGPRKFLKAYPYVAAGCGAIDLLGHPGAPALLARATWGLLDGPAIAVRPPHLSGQRARRTPWRSTDAVPSWAWQGCEGRPAHLEVYSADDEVEVLVNGRSLGRQPGGSRAGFVSRFQTPWAPGEVTAIGYRNGVEAGRSTLRSAGPVQLRLRAESPVLRAGGQDLAFVHVEVTDPDGVVECLRDTSVTVTVEGPATLAGLGSAAASTTGSYLDATTTTHLGRALAVVRAGDRSGRVVVRGSSSLGSASVELTAT